MRAHLTLILLCFLAFSNVGRASHIMGGEITWNCLGSGQYEFDLVLYRDCNGLDIVDPFLDLEVWGHPTITSIQCDLVGSIDLSPNCTQVNPAYPELDCGVGTGGGNGPGAVQKYTYRSAPVTLTGTPPAGGWAFTYDSFSRNWGLSNIDLPMNYGITLSAYMFALPNGASANPCSDSSPQFAQDPYMLVCNGTNVSYDANAFDPDNDSLAFSWGIPLDHFPSGSFDPPTNPAPVPFVAGYAYDNPTPDTNFDPGNIPASMDPQTGNITFLSNNNGNYGIVQKIDSYRDGQLISTIHREFQMIIIDCINYNNNPPVITPVFDGGTSFDTTIFAGDLINFDIIIEDLELLQDGTPQTVTLNPTGNYFGTNLIDPMNGCDYTPCATLDQAPIISGVQGVTAVFNWQTSCDHLLDANGVQQASQTYTFVLNAEDDYCTVPGRTYETIRITLLNQAVVQPVDLHCVDVLPNGDVTLSWTQTTDPGTSFVEYQVWSIQDGYIASVPGITTETFTVVGANCDVASKDYFIQTRFGCGGNNLSPSDTLSSIFLDINDLGDGRLHLTWNSMANPQNAGDANMEEVWREYPAGTWTMRGTVPFGTNEFVDTVDVCSDFLTYEIRIPNAAGCTSTSNDPGGLYQDIINPYIPVMYWVTVDTVTGNVTMCWEQNAALDTYGYEIYGLVNGFWIPIDTVWGIGTTCYTTSIHNADIHPESYRITAFDSCYTTAVPPTFQTSALSTAHTTVHGLTQYDICAKDITLNWTAYNGWTDGVDHYDVIVSIGGSPFDVIATVDGNTFQYNHTNQNYDLNYCYYIRAVGVNDSISYSNRFCQFTDRPSEANWHYLASASYNLGNEVEVLTYTDGAASVNSYEVEVMGPFDSVFDLAEILQPTGSNWIQYNDFNVQPDAGSYAYKVSIIDSCGNVGFVSNVARTVFLEVETDHTAMQNVLSWTSYVGFDGSILQYNIYRGEDGIFPATPIATTIPGVRSYVDDVSDQMDSEGQFCYRVEAVEETNSYGFEETAFSNTVCATIEPLVYIPNAFIINGENPVFKPVISLYEFDSYQLDIFDRWGRVIFTTDNADAGWNGTGVGNGLVSEGVYVYMLTFEDRDAKEYVYRGTVTMLIDRP